MEKCSKRHYGALFSGKMLKNETPDKIPMVTQPGRVLTHLDVAFYQEKFDKISKTRFFFFYDSKV